MGREVQLHSADAAHPRGRRRVHPGRRVRRGDARCRQDGQAGQGGGRAEVSARREACAPRRVCLLYPAGFSVTPPRVVLCCEGVLSKRTVEVSFILEIFFAFLCFLRTSLYFLLFLVCFSARFVCRSFASLPSLLAVGDI